jgi:hypothetical protein
MEQISYTLLVYHQSKFQNSFLEFFFMFKLLTEIHYTSFNTINCPIANVTPIFQSVPINWGVYRKKFVWNWIFLVSFAIL